MITIIEFIKETIIPLAKKHKELEIHLSLLALFWLLSYQYSDGAFQVYAHLLYLNIILYCMPLMLLTISYLFFMYLKYRPKYDKYLNVYWDKNNNMHCPSCKKLLAPSFLGTKVDTNDKSVFQCNFCNKKTILKKDDGTPISKEQAIDEKTHITK